MTAAVRPRRVVASVEANTAAEFHQKLDVAMAQSPSGDKRAVITSLALMVADEIDDKRLRAGAKYINASEPSGRRPFDDAATVAAIVEKIERGIPLNIALAKFDKTSKDRLRPKVQKKLRSGT